jgi:hypothetical protein
MKGSHISKKTQRRLTRPKDFHSMSIEQLQLLVIKGEELEYKFGYTKAKQKYPYLMADAKAARSELRTQCGYSY